MKCHRMRVVGMSLSLVMVGNVVSGSTSPLGEFDESSD